MKAIFAWVLERLSEPSTWQGLVTIVSAAGISITPDLALNIATAGASLVGIINVVKKG